MSQTSLNSQSKTSGWGLRPPSQIYHIYFSQGIYCKYLNNEVKHLMVTHNMAPYGYWYFLPVTMESGTSKAQNQTMVRYLAEYQVAYKYLSKSVTARMTYLGTMIGKTKDELEITNIELGAVLGLQSWITTLLVDGSFMPWHITADLWQAIYRIANLEPNKSNADFQHQLDIVKSALTDL